MELDCRKGGELILVHQALRASRQRRSFGAEYRPLSIFCSLIELKALHLHL
jgi:hypothetical protein